MPAMPVLGKRQRLAVLQLTVNQFPRGKHWRFNSSLPHGVGSLPTQRVGNWRMPYNKKTAISVVLCQRLKCRHTAYGNALLGCSSVGESGCLIRSVSWVRIPSYQFHSIPKKHYSAGAWWVVVMDGLFQEIAPSRCRVPIMVLEPVAIRSGVYSPCRFESYTLHWSKVKMQTFWRTLNNTERLVCRMSGWLRERS